MNSTSNFGNGAVERGDNMGRAKDLAQGAGENAALSQKENFGSVPHPVALAGQLRAAGRASRDPVFKSHCSLARSAVERLAVNPDDDRAKEVLADSYAALTSRKLEQGNG